MKMKKKMIVVGILMTLVCISQIVIADGGKEQPPSFVDLLDNTNFYMRPYWDQYQNSVPYRMEPPIIPFKSIYNNWRLITLLWGFE